MAAPPQFLGVSIPGHLPVLTWTQVSPQRLIANCTITQPASFVSLFLLGSMPLPTADVAAALYMTCSLDPSSRWFFAGSVTNANPADVFPMPFSVTQPCQIQLGISLEPAASLPPKPPMPSASPAAVAGSSAPSASAGPLFTDQELMTLGTAVATDFFRYLESFAGPGDTITVPGGSLNNWLQKFTARTKRDPMWWKTYNTKD